jgi:mono/diheme cytochrome c family protein
MSLTVTRATAALALLCAVPPAARAADASKLPPPASQADVTYAKHIKPILDRSCVKCHGEEKQKAGLRLDSLKAVLDGADGEAVIKPGKSAESVLVFNVARVGDDEDAWMPPEGKAPILTKDEVGLVRAWIDQGAK